MNNGEEEHKKGWKWDIIQSEKAKKQWVTPALEVYSYMSRWKEQKKKDFLDLGCGIGRHAVLFGKQGFNINIIDVSSDAIKRTNEWLSVEGVSCQSSRVEDMDNMSFEDNSFDCILSWQVINHNDTLGVKKVISEIYRILKPGGEVALTIPSKKTYGYQQDWPVVDENTKLNMANPAENQIPHFYADYDLIKTLFNKFELIKVDEVCQCKQFETGRETPDSFKFIILARKSIT